MSVAARALGLLLTKDDGFELVSTLFAEVFENWHFNSRQIESKVAGATRYT
jgi:hypothetical protein